MLRHIDFVGKNTLFGIISVVLVLLSGFSIFYNGLNYGIDFAGGVEMQVRFNEEVQPQDIRNLLSKLEIESSQVQQLGSGTEYLIRFEDRRTDGANLAEETKTEVTTTSGVSTDKLTGEETTSGEVTGDEEDVEVSGTVAELRAAILSEFSGPPEILRVDQVGPRIGSQLKRNGMLAIFYSLILILIYVGLRFDYNFAPGAAICLFHDSIITLGVFSFLGKEINVQILAAVLTIIGYSLNDTIVIFDRIRENISLYKNNKLPWIINRSINDVISRTLLTSITTLVAVVSLYVLAGGVISDFAFALGIGVIIGTYSSIYIASPLVIQFEKLKSKKRV